MTLTMKRLAEYLGGEASALLSDEPFSRWAFEKSREDDLDPPRIDYVFPAEGVDVVCDEHDTVSTIFLHFADDDRDFREGLSDLPASLTRQAVVAVLGTPSKSGEPMIHPVLGAYGPWDRFSISDYAVHVQYDVDTGRMRQVTFMRLDAVP